MNKILNKIRQIIAGNKECNYGCVNKKENKSNNSARNAKEKDANKVGRNRWGFPTFPRKSK